MEIEAEDFLELVHGTKKGWVGLPAKVGKYWVEFSTSWPGDGVITRRIDTCLRDKEDLYYSAALFSEKGRKIENVMGSAWLWADLDEVHPTSAGKLGYLPTVAIQSSPGRYQALWRLKRELPPKSLEKLNRALSYALDADRGGWDLTQVLRLPGTRNFKYADAPMVELMWINDLIYEPRAMWGRLREMLPADEFKVATSVDIPRRGISARARVLLRTKPDQVVSGERSTKLWELECLLAEAGLGVDEIHELVWNTAWNKHRSVHTGRVRLEREILKAIRHVQRQLALKARGSSKENQGPTKAAAATEEGLPLMGYSSTMAQEMEEPKWLVEDIWAADSQGIIGGEPKTAKTTLALALGLAVASGKPFLGKYPVPGAGPVVFIQEENAPWMIQDRLRKLSWHSGLIPEESVQKRHVVQGDLARKGSVVLSIEFPPDLPFYLLNNYGFDLADPDHTQAMINTCHYLRPKLIILDPLYLILGDADGDRAKELKPFLKLLLALRMENNCSVILVHHMRKRTQGVKVRAGQNLLGSTTLHGWVDSALYLSDRESNKPGWKSILVEREFRSMAPQMPIELDISMGEPGTLEMEVDITDFDILGKVRSRAKREPGILLTTVAEELEMSKQVLRARIIGTADCGIEVKSSKRGRGYSHELYAT